jgi:hypothetical protein
MTCQGNSSEYCGGPDRLNVYNYTGSSLPTPAPGGGGGGGNGGGIDLPPATTGLPANWSYVDCYM